ncbi:hypothetical protein KKE26_04375, partial [bacterium]|nr:hypothetical protein [bacterium]
SDSKSLICQELEQRAAHARRTAGGSKPVICSAGNKAPRLGNNAPLSIAHSRCNKAKFVPIDRDVVMAQRAVIV